MDISAVPGGAAEPQGWFVQGGGQLPSDSRWGASGRGAGGQRVGAPADGANGQRIDAVERAKKHLDNFFHNMVFTQKSP